ncbi:MAG TPA: very short patch repair endonuclease [Actinomycetota bacterium]|nr:very short patch repair endonuclease [Actinomycetota bacterium]
MSGASLRPPRPTSLAATAAMRGNRRADTAPELRLRSALHRRGYRFRKDFPLPGAGRSVRVDIVFPGRRLAVFVDGCFWHGCAQHCRVPKGNADYWAPKLQGNARRDRLTDQVLAEGGWRVLRIWEHEPIDSAVALVLEALGARDAQP